MATGLASARHWTCDDVSLGIGTLFEQMGNVGYLQPYVAAWAPDTLFSLAGLYLMLRMRS